MVSRTCPLALFSVLLLFFASGITAATVKYQPFYLNASLIHMCDSAFSIFNPNCSILNPAFWFNETVPSSPLDAVYVIIPNTNETTSGSTLYLNGTLNVASLTLSGLISLEVQTGSLLEVLNMTLHEGATMSLGSYSLVQTNGTVDIDFAHMMLTTATYHQLGGSFMLRNMSAITSTNGTLDFATAVIGGDMFLDTDSHISANTITFNKSQSINAIVSVDKAIVPYITINFTNGATINQLNSTGSSFVAAGPSISITSITADAGGSIDILGELTSTTINSTVQFSVYGNLNAQNLRSSGPLLVTGNMQVANLNLTGGAANAVLGFSSDRATLSKSATLTVGGSFAISSVLNVTNSSVVYLLNAQAYINSTKLGSNGFIVVNNSVLNLNSSYTLPNARLNFTGACNVYAPSVYINDFQYGDSPSVHIFASSGIQINSSVVFPGALSVNGIFTAIGSVTVLGRIDLIGVTAYVKGSFSPLGGIYFNSTTLTVDEGSTLNVSSTLVVGPSSTMNCVYKTTIIAQVVNVGKLITAAANPVAITGKFTQTATGNLQINSLNRGLPAFISVRGTAVIAGVLTYSPLVIASGETAKLPVLVTTDGITGKFENPTRAFEKLTYPDGKNMYLVFSENSGERLHLTWAFVFVLIVSLLY